MLCILIIRWNKLYAPSDAKRVISYTYSTKINGIKQSQEQVGIYVLTFFKYSITGLSLSIWTAYTLSRKSEHVPTICLVHQSEYSESTIIFKTGLSHIWDECCNKNNYIERLLLHNISSFVDKHISHALKRQYKDYMRRFLHHHTKM